jgi:hypothetical protein
LPTASKASKDMHALYHVFLILTSSPPTHNIFHAANVHRWGDSSQETHAIFTLADTAATNALQLLGVGDPVKQGSKPKPSNKRGSGGNKAGPAKKAKNSRAQPGGTRSSGSSSSGTTSSGGAAAAFLLLQLLMMITNLSHRAL